MQGKNRRNLAKFVIILLGIFIPSFIFFGLWKGSIYAATSDAVNLQGKIVRNDVGYEGLNITAGSPTCVVSGSGNDTCDFRVRYYDASSGGNLLLTEEFSNVEIGEYLGVFNLSLGSDSSPTAGVYSSFSGLVQGEDDVYVEMGFDPSGSNIYTEVFTRMPLEATAYAIRAKYADTATGATEVPWSGLQDPTEDLTIEHSTRKTLFNWATGTGTDDLFTLTSNASATGTGALMNVQTGTGSALVPLRVRSGSTEAIYVNSSGNVGIGTTSLTYKLEVDGDTNLSTGSVFRIGGASVLSSTTLGSSVTGSSLTSVGTLTSGTWNASTIGEEYGGTGQTGYAAGDILYASGVNTLAKRAIGSNNQVLTVSGGVPVWSDVGAASSVAFSGITSGTNTTAAMVVGAGASLNYTSTGTINASSLQGSTWAVPGAIGSTTPNTGAFTTLSASTSLTTPLVIGTSNSLTLRPTTNAVNAIRLANAAGAAILSVDTINSRIGIGTISPDSALHVEGQVKITGGTPGTNKVLTSDVAGLASWSDLSSLGGVVTSITGTTNQITASASTGDVVLSIPTDFRAPGTVNAVDGIYTGATAGTQRIDGSGNLLNIGTITFAGADVSMSRTLANILSLAAGDSFNLVSGSLQVAGTEVITSGRLVMAADGSATTPAFSFSGDTNTGMYSGGTNILKFATAGADRVTVLANGNVGIGATSPEQKLTVVRDNTSTPIISADLMVYGDTSALIGARGNNDSVEFLMGVSSKGEAFAGSVTTHAMSLRTQNVNRLTIDSAGLVGIGTDNPLAKLHVKGNQILLKNEADADVGFVIDGGSTATYRDVISFRDRGIDVFALEKTSTNAFQLYDYLNSGVSRLLFGAGSNSGISMRTMGTGDFSFINDTTTIVTIKSDGNVGIGTTSPEEKFVVSKSLSASQYNWPIVLRTNRLETPDGAGAGIKFLHEAGSATKWAGIAAYAETAWSNKMGLSFFTNNQLATPIEAVRIMANGNVGIGTTSPKAKLDIGGRAWIDDLFLSSSRTLNAYGVPEVSSGISGEISFGANTNDKAKIYSTVSGGATGLVFYVADDAEDYFDFTNQNNSLMRIKYSGNVGIGTTSPAAKLEVNAGGNGATSILMANYDKLKFGGSSEIGAEIFSYTDDTWYFDNEKAADIVFRTNGGSEVSRVQHGGNVGIGTTSPKEKLEVWSAYNLTGIEWALSVRNPGNSSSTDPFGVGIKLRNDGALDSKWSGIAAVSESGYANYMGLALYANEAERVRIKYNGNVGIGTTNPLYKLDVAETSRINGDLILGANGTIDDDTTLGGNSDDWIRLNGYIELKSNTDSYGIVLRDKDATDYFAITQVDGVSYLTDSSTYGNYFIRGDGANATVRGRLGIATTSPGYALDVNGDIQLNGDLRINNGGTANTWYVIDSAGTTDWNFYTVRSSNTVAKFVNVDATYTMNMDVEGAYNDFAETVSTPFRMYEGDIVITHESSKETVNYTSKAYDPRLIGALSTAPGVLLSSAEDINGEKFTSLGTSGKTIYFDHEAPLTLSGRIPVKVSTINGIINNGDSITSSSIPAFGMKATESGPIVGQATESFIPSNLQCESVNSIQAIIWPEDDGHNENKPCFKLPDGTYVGKVMVFVNVSWYDPKPGELLARVEDIEAQLASINDDTNPIYNTLSLNENLNILTVDSHFVPSVNNTYDLGTSTNRWKDIYAQGIVRLGSSIDNGGIKYNPETKRLELSNDGETWIPLGSSTNTVLLSAQYPGSVVLDGLVNNIGEMTMNNTGLGNASMNYYQWESSESNLNDKEINITYQLPSDFKEWGPGGITLSFATESISALDNKVDLYVYEQNASGYDGVSEGNISIENGKWQTTKIEGSQLNMCNEAEDVCTIQVKMSSSLNNYARVGDIKIKYERTL